MTAHVDWISCSDALPAVGEMVLIYAPPMRAEREGTMFVAYLVDDYRNGAGWDINSYEPVPLEAYTHWAALPPKPERP